MPRGPLAAMLAGIRQWPLRRVVSPLIARLFHDGKVKWHAVSALGAVVAALTSFRGP